MTNIEQAKKIMGKNFIGPNELSNISEKLNITNISGKIPKIPYSEDNLNELYNDYILILGVPDDKDGHPITINRMREIFGVDPEISEPCLYNQDWYLNENFAGKTNLKLQWYLVRKNILEDSRAQMPEEIQKKLADTEQFPTAILTAFVFFAYYFHTNGEILWKHDFLWCNDTDHNGDRIYTGRYEDPTKINKNGFNVHRHLSLRPCYGAITSIIN